LKGVLQPWRDPGAWVFDMWGDAAVVFAGDGEENKCGEGDQG